VNRKDLKSLVSLLEPLDDKEAQRLVKKINKELKPISVSARKSKGRKLQQDVCEILSHHTGYAWGYDSEMIQPRMMGGSGTDVLLIGPARDEIPFDIECKNVESFNLKSTIEQAKANTEGGRDWLVVHKRNGMNPIAILDLKRFFSYFFKN